MNRQTLPLVMLLVALVGGQHPVYAQRDQVFGDRGTPTNGTITEVTPYGITIQVGSVSRHFPLNEIQRITLDGDPNELRRAREAIQQGRYEDARAELSKINVADVSRDLVRQDVEYYKAFLEARLALTGGGDKAAALENVLNFVKAKPQSYHFLEAAETLGDLAVALGKYEEAARYYAALGKAPWSEYRMRSALLEARALRFSQQWDAARQRYETVLATEVDSPDANRLKLMATIGRSVCLAETGNPQEGIQAIQQIIAHNDAGDVELFGRAYNALGACYLRADQPQEALLAYLHVDVVFFAEPEAHAEALFHLSRLWSDMNKSERAVRARSLLQNRYAGTNWARQL